MIVVSSSKVVSPLALRLTRVLSDMEQAGVQLSSGCREILLRSSASSAPVSGARIAPTGLQLAMQTSAKVIEATDEDLRVINERHSAQELTKDDVVVFQDYACSTARVVRPPIKFTRAYLDRMAEKATEGRTVLHDHREDRHIGTTFQADVVTSTVRGVEAEWLRTRWYAVLNDQTSDERRQLIQDCRTGVLRYTSIRALGGSWTFTELEGPDGPEYFYEIDDAADADLGEVSRVYKGAVSGAGDHKFSAKETTPLNPSDSPKPSQVLCVL